MSSLCVGPFDPLYSMDVNHALNSDPCFCNHEWIDTDPSPFPEKNCSKQMPPMEKISQIFCQERPVL